MFFRSLDQGALDDVARCIYRRNVTSGEHILLEGEEPGSAYFVAEGQVRIYRMSPAGREQALADLLPGQVFNLVPIIDGRPAPSSAVARTDVALYAISRPDFLRLIRAYPAVAEAVLQDFAGRLRYLTGLIEALSLRSVPERLAQALLDMVREDQPPAARFTQQDLATKLGTVREVISRTLKNFEKDGLISMQRHQIVILDAERLASIANQD